MIRPDHSTLANGDNFIKFACLINMTTLLFSVHTLVLIIFNRMAKRNENDRTVFQILSLSALIAGLDLCDIEDLEECQNYVLWTIVVTMGPTVQIFYKIT